MTDRPPDKKVSVIVPIYGTAEPLRKCLGGLLGQSYTNFEVLVCDNNSGRRAWEVRAMVKSCACYGIRYLHEPIPGSYAARNAGLRVAAGDIIAFTDADCIPEPDWIKAGVEALEDADILAGKVVFFFRNPERISAIELYDSMGISQEHHVRENFGATANLFVRRTVFETIDVFDEKLKSSGDREWGQRATGAGFRLVYSNSARVGHPARYTLRALVKRTRRLMGGYANLNCKRQCLRKAISYLKPPVSMLRYKIQDERLHSLQRHNFVFLVLLIRLVSCAELLLLIMAISSPRRD